eukprot:TRINITY_DN59585_c0_g1_i1.p1 TRINITY_DN59585_c0_g1~~TRINITY_DN59585_c0_g1_i1.p1  ORF type:complete len:275 (+),score=71.07 TRINITY_DN59585_c0_g1_i1:56-880(+)
MGRSGVLGLAELIAPDARAAAAPALGLQKSHGVSATSFIVNIQEEAKEHELISGLSREFQAGMTKLSSASDVQQALGTQLDATLKAGVDKLKGKCHLLRDKLEHLADIRAACQRAQSDTASGLPALFTARAKEPERFARAGKIKGCAAEGAVGGPEQPPADAECTCSGTEELGCQDAKNTADHELICTRIIEKQIKDLDALDAFQPGGICRLDGQEEVTRALLPMKDFQSIRHVAAAGIPAVLTAAACLPPRRRSGRLRCRQQRHLQMFIEFLY